MAKLGEKFDMYDDPTPPRADGQQREESREDASPPPPKPPRQGARSRPRTAAEMPPEMSKSERDRWRWLLGATAGKSAAAHQRAREAAQAWERVVADARASGVPERMLMAAALEADVDLPADS